MSMSRGADDAGDKTLRNEGTPERPDDDSARAGARPLAFRVDAGEAGRADRVLASRFPGLSRRTLAALFRRGAVRVDGRPARKGTLVAQGSEIVLAELPRAARQARPAPAGDLELEVLHVDADLVAVAKPGALASHPLWPDSRDTLANALCARFPECASASADAREAGLVHRLDTGTSGVLVAARHPAAWQALRRAFGDGEVVKLYWALVAGTDIEPETCTVPLATRGARAVVVRDRAGPGALPAWTRWRALARYPGHTLLGCITTMGRRHQVRVHLAHRGLPIMADALYGGPPAPPAPLTMTGHFLHARAITLPHPRSGARLRIVAPLPPDRQAVLDHIRAAQPDPAR